MPQGDVKTPSARTLGGLDWLNFFLADVQTGIGPFLAIYLAGYGWDEERVGIALTAGGIAGILTQTPAGALVDRLRSKRALIAAGIVALAMGALLIALTPTLWSVMSAQVLIGGTSSIFGPAICAISLGVVGHRLFDRRQGRNQAFNSAGNVMAAISMGLLGYYISNRSIFFFVLASTVPTILTLLVIRPAEIDYELARGAKEGGKDVKPVKAYALLKDRPLLIFLICAVMFHFANAAMLPLLGEMLAKGQGRSSMMFMSACVVTTQFVITLLSSWSGRKAGAWGRKPLLLLAFGVLPVRAVLYTLTTNTGALVAIQILDGVGAGIFGVVSVLVIADLTRGTGRFNLTLGAISTAVGIGASLSQVIAGSIVHHFGSNVGFLFLAAVASAALGILYFFMPDTMKEPGSPRKVGLGAVFNPSLQTLSRRPQMLYLGIDQHKRQLTVNLRNEDGTVILQRQVSTEWEKVRAFFADLAEKAKPEGGFLAILEVCGMNPWLLDMLKEYGCQETVVIQPRERSKQKTDRRDAGKLGHLLWVHRQQFLEGKHPLGLRRIQPPTPQEADDRQLTMLRARLTKKRTAVLNGLHRILRKHNLEQACPTKLFQTKKVRRWLTELELPAIDRLEIDILLPQWELLDEQLELAEAKIVERACEDEQVKLLETIPGIGHYSAVAIASRIGDINRFKHPDSLANFFGLTPGCRNSGEATQRLGSITKQGSRMVRFLLNQAVVKVLRFDGEMRAWFKRIKKRRGSKIARVAVMRRLVTIIWHMLKKKQKYRYNTPIKKHQEFETFEGTAV